MTEDDSLSQGAPDFGAGAAGVRTSTSSPSAKRMPASAHAFSLSTTPSASPAQAARTTAVCTPCAQAAGGAGIGSLSGGVTLPPDQPAAKASQVVAAR